MPSPAPILSTDLSERFIVDRPDQAVVASGRSRPIERPLSLFVGTDQQAMRSLLELHAPPPPWRMLDVTWGAGRFYRGLAFRPDVRVDLRPGPGVSHLGDFRNLRKLQLAADPSISVRLPTAGFDVVVFDPPGYPEAGARSVHGSRFGLHADSALAHTPDISVLFKPFLTEAHRVLRPNGIILAKIGDITHRGVRRKQVARFLAEADAMKGMSACDWRIVAHLPLSKGQAKTLDRLRKRAFEEHDTEVLALLEHLVPKGATRAHTLVGGNWDNVRHSRINYVYWIAVRNGSCMRPEKLAWSW